jgi:hypothetical protein
VTIEVSGSATTTVNGETRTTPVNAVDTSTLSGGVTARYFKGAQQKDMGRWNSGAGIEHAFDNLA